jgi:putative tricarboxylic transport membrane protein
MSELGSGLLLALSPAVLPYVALGVFIGLVIGLLPGLGGPVAVAVLLPFTFGMEPAQAFGFLIAMLAVTAVSSDLTAIIFGVPGEPTSAALVLDGHALARQGKAGLAIGASLTSSLLGGFLGAVVLALAIPMVRPIVLAFASPEMFMVAMLGLAFIASLSQGSVRKGVIIVALGLLASSVGLARATGVPRYTLGMAAMWDGLGLVAVTVGLFGIPSVYNLATKGTSIAEEGLSEESGSGFFMGVAEALRHWWLVVRCSGIGAFIGVLPGLGGPVAQWMAYAHAQQTSKEREKFGRGALDGVLGPGAANNAKEGGSLVPTVAFGIPGSVTMAMLLAAFLMHGIAPGPSMLGENLTLTMSFIWLVVIANCFAVGFCFIAHPLLVRFTGFPSGLLLAPIMWLLIIGAFAERRSFLAVIVMILAGVLGIVMDRLDWPKAPLLLGLVLGPLVENYLYISVNRYGIGWLSRPLVMGLGLAALVVLFGPPVLRRLRNGGKALEPQPVEDWS